MPLLEKNSYGRMQPKGKSALQKLFSHFYDCEVDLRPRLEKNLLSIAEAINNDRHALAAIMLVHLNLPRREVMAKYNPNHAPAGSSDGGQFTSGDNGPQYADAGNRATDGQVDDSSSTQKPHYVKMTPQQVGNIIYNETRALSGPGINEARVAIAHTIRNGEDERGAKRPKTAPDDVKPVPDTETAKYQDCINSAIQADKEREQGIDPTKWIDNSGDVNGDFTHSLDPSMGANLFDLTVGPATKPSSDIYPLITSYGPFNNSHPSKDKNEINTKDNAYINFYQEKFNHPKKN